MGYLGIKPNWSWALKVILPMHMSNYMVEIFRFLYIGIGNIGNMTTH